MEIENFPTSQIDANRVRNFITFDFAVCEFVLSVWKLVHFKNLDWLFLSLLILNECTIFILFFIIRSSRVEEEHISKILLSENECLFVMNINFGIRFSLFSFLNLIEIEYNIAIFSNRVGFLSVLIRSWLNTNSHHHFLPHKVHSSQVNSFTFVV